MVSLQKLAASLSAPVVQECHELLGENRGNEDVRDVLLALEDHYTRVGQRVGHSLDLCLVGIGALFTDEKDHRHGDLRCRLWIERGLRLGAALSGDRVRGCDAPRPRGVRPEGREILLGHQLEVAEQRLHDRVAIALGQERVHALLDFYGQSEHCRVRDGPSLILVASALLFSGGLMFYAGVKRRM